MESKGRQIHGKAAQARERGESVEALKLDMEAMDAYQKEGDNLGFAEIQAEIFLTLRHLFEKTGHHGYQILAKHAAMSSVELAEVSGDKTALAIPQFNLAKAQEDLGELQDAVGNYQKAVENIINNPPAPHNVPDRPAIIADFQSHLATCEYKTGDKSALERAEQAALDLEKAEDMADYNKHVWLSGAHMRIADVLRVDSPEKANEHLQKAKEIIDSDERLILRKKQWEKLAQSLS